MFCFGILPLFFKAQVLCNSTSKIFHQIEMREEMTIYLPGRTLSGSFLCCNIMHYLFRKAFCNILIQKFQNYSPLTGYLALYMSLF